MFDNVIQFGSDGTCLSVKRWRVVPANGQIVFFRTIPMTCHAIPGSKLSFHDHVFESEMAASKISSSVSEVLGHSQAA